MITILFLEKSPFDPPELITESEKPPLTPKPDIMHPQLVKTRQITPLQQFKVVFGVVLLLWHAGPTCQPFPSLTYIWGPYVITYLALPTATRRAPALPARGRPCRVTAALAVRARGRGGGGEPHRGLDGQREAAEGVAQRREAAPGGGARRERAWKRSGEGPNSSREGRMSSQRKESKAGSLEKENRRRQGAWGSCNGGGENGG